MSQKDKEQATNKAKKQPKPKQLSMNKIKNQARENRRMEEYTINDKDEVIKFYPVFPDGMVDELLMELREDFVYAEENEIDLDDEHFLLGYIYFLAIKHFTSLKKGFSDKLEDKILQFEYMKDAGYYDIIVKEVFMPKELNKVTEKLAEVFATDKFMQDIQSKADQKLGQLKFRNKELLDDLEEQMEQVEHSDEDENIEH